MHVLSKYPIGCKRVETVALQMYAFSTVFPKTLFFEKCLHSIGYKGCLTGITGDKQFTSIIVIYDGNRICDSGRDSALIKRISGSLPFRWVNCEVPSGSEPAVSGRTMRFSRINMKLVLFAITQATYIQPSFGVRIQSLTFQWLATFFAKQSRPYIIAIDVLHTITIRYQPPSAVPCRHRRRRGYVFFSDFAGDKIVSTCGIKCLILTSCTTYINHIVKPNLLLYGNIFGFFFFLVFGRVYMVCIRSALSPPLSCIAKPQRSHWISELMHKIRFMNWH